MTQWTTMPLRPQGQPWPGLNTRGGRLDPGQGFLEDGSINAIINEGDILAKRKGFIRGLEERFGTVVCGLFSYTDDCGIEYLVIADNTGISVRTPFSIPEFLGSDSLPFDSFEGTLSTTRWTNTSAYVNFLGSLRLSGLDALGATAFVPTTQLLGWFKDSALSSYFVEVNYRLAAGSISNACAVVVKRDATTDTYLAAAIRVQGTTYVMQLDIVRFGVRTNLAEVALGGSSIADGFLRLSYDASSRTATARAIPSGGNIATLSQVLTEVQDADLGQASAIGLVRGEGTVDPEIESVSGGAA